MEHRIYVSRSLKSLLIGLVIGLLISRFMVWSNGHNNIGMQLNNIQIYLSYTLMFGYMGFAIYGGFTTIKNLLLIQPLTGLGCILTVLVWPAIIMLLFGFSIAIGFFVSIPKFIYHILKIKKS